MFSTVTLISAAAALLLATCGQASIPSNWIEYTPGTCNVVISSPHGGSIRADEIEDRTDGCLGPDGNTCIWDKGCSPADSSECRASVAKDSYTQEIASMVTQHLADTHNCAPHFVRSNLYRGKMDPNREVTQGAQGDPMAVEAWQAYHQHMTAAVTSVKSQFGKGLVFDIHGQGHSEQWTEVGYLLSRYKLNAGPSSLTSSSIRGLGARSGLTTPNLINGPSSFGSLLSARGQKVVPSASYPSPGTGNYYSGGYITERYGSIVDGQVDAIQVEIPNGIRFDSNLRATFAEDLSATIHQFMQAHGY